MALKQDNRHLHLTTPLGADELVLLEFHGREEFSQLFSYELEMLSDNTAIAATDIVGKAVTWSVKRNNDEPRFFHGYVSRFSAGDEDQGRRVYRAEVVPWLWFLTRTSDCRVFQNLSVKEILEQVFGDLGFATFETSQIKGSHPKREYCVQYRETDFAFVSRLMEEEGIFYFFRHEDGKHQMVLADQKGAYEDCVENEVDYPTDRSRVAVEECITAWEHQYEFRSGKWTQTDYNFETPSTSLMTTVQSSLPLPGIDKYEFFDYPGEYYQRSEGDSLTKLRIEAEEADFDTVNCESECKTFTPGGKFKIRQHRCSAEEGKSYVIKSIEHQAKETLAHETSRSASPGMTYGNRLVCIPDTVTFRPPRITPRPSVQGVQSAVIVGPPGETIHPDKYGRVKVQFFWDRRGKKDDQSSCWIRVTQNWGGGNWGGMFIPHVGQEVIVSFIEGDPDRPIITGRVYNGEMMPPLELPSNKTKSAIRDHGGNEIVLEGDGGKQQIVLHSPHSNSFIHIGDARNPPMGIGATTEQFMTFNIGQSWDVFIGANETTSVEGNAKKEVAGSSECYVRGAYTQYVMGTVSVRTLGSESTMTVGVKNEVLISLNNKLTKGGLVEINSAKELFKSPSVKEAVGYFQVKYGQWKAKKAQALTETAAEDKLLAARIEARAKGEMKHQADTLLEFANDLKQKATDMEQKASTIKRKADNFIEKGTKKLTGKLIVNGTEFKVS